MKVNNNLLLLILVLGTQPPVYAGGSSFSFDSAPVSIKTVAVYGSLGVLGFATLMWKHQENKFDAILAHELKTLGKALEPGFCYDQKNYDQKKWIQQFKKSQTEATQKAIPLQTQPTQSGLAHSALKKPLSPAGRILTAEQRLASSLGSKHIQKYNQSPLLTPIGYAAYSLNASDIKKFLMDDRIIEEESLHQMCQRLIERINLTNQQIALIQPKAQSVEGSSEEEEIEKIKDDAFKYFDQEIHRHLWDYVTDSDDVKEKKRKKKKRRTNPDQKERLHKTG